MTLLELREHAAALAQQAETERKQFANALQSMDYDRALDHQIERELERVESALSSSRLYLRPDRKSCRGAAGLPGRRFNGRRHILGSRSTNI